MPKVFISYAHEDEKHNKWVENLASELIKCKVDAFIDELELSGGDDIAHFSETMVSESDFVILVCTPLFKIKSDKILGGVGFEKSIITVEMLRAKELNNRFIPIIKKGSFEKSLPTYLKSKYAIDFRNESKYEDSFRALLRAIYKLPHPNKPAKGYSQEFINQYLNINIHSDDETDTSFNRQNNMFRREDMNNDQIKIKYHPKSSGMAINKKDNKELVYVPEGEFLMGSEDIEVARPQTLVFLNAYWIYKTPVTNYDLFQLIKQQHYKPKYWNYDENKFNHPAVNITWQDARVYANWAGGELPSEAQWEKAARGIDGRKYPWGNDIDIEKCNIKLSNIKGTTTVDKYPDSASPFGVIDMIGNVWEWTDSLYKPYPYIYNDGREDIHERGPRILRGGSFYSDENCAVCAFRYWPDTFNKGDDFGFRLVINTV